MFAGQNSFEPGMGEIAFSTDQDAERTFKVASDVFEVDMTEICFGSRTEELSNYAQQAVVTTELADFHYLYNQGFDPNLLMGHSVGEFACLGVAKVVSERNLFKLTKKRAETTTIANEQKPGSMAAILGLDDEQVALLLHRVNAYLDKVKDPARAYLANKNWDLEKVLSGHQDALERFERTVAMLKSLRILRRAKFVHLTKIPGAFHSPHNEEAVADLREAFMQVNLSPPEIPILGNNVRYLDEIADYPDYFSNQLVSGVDFQQMMHVASKDGITGFKEVGGQGTLEGFVKKEFPNHEIEARPYGEIVVVRQPE